MGNLFWHFFSRPNYENEFLNDFNWLIDTDLYTGKYTDLSGKIAKSQKHIGASGGKLTRSFATALIRAADAIVKGNDSFNAFGMNDKYSCCETLLRESSTIDGMPRSSCSSVTKENRVACIYNKKSGSFTVSYDKQKVTADVYFLALFPSLMEDSEFNQVFSRFVALYRKFAQGYHTLPQEEIEELLGSLKRDSVIAADAAYYLMKEGRNKKTTVPASEDVSVADVESAKFIRQEYIPTRTWGHFILRTDMEDNSASNIPVDKGEFAGKYVFGHTLTKEEEVLVPQIPENETPSSLTRTICQAICESTKKARHIRNVLLYGPTGTGKSTMAKHIAAGLNLPYVSFNCNADTTIMDLLVQCMPADKNLADEKHVKASPADGIPTIDEMIYDPDEAWFSMTGERAVNVTCEKCMSKAYQMSTGEKKDVTIGEYVSFLLSQGSNTSNDGQFMYVESPLVKAVRNGWVVEIQEPTTIVQAGVLPGLNSLLDAPGSIFLPNGEVVQRHPDCITVATTNLNYQGCRAVNQSFLRRFQFKAIVKNPNADETLSRLKEMVGYDDKNDYVTEKLMKEMITVAAQIKARCDELDLTEGDIGICEVADWVNAANMVGSIRKSAEWTIVPSATQDDDGIQNIQDIVRQKFAD